MTLVLANAHVADAAGKQPYIESPVVKSYKTTHYSIFKVCAGDERLSRAGVIVTSGIDAVPLKIKSIPAATCESLSVQVKAKNPATIKPTLVTSSEIDHMKNKWTNVVKSLKQDIGDLEKSLTKPGPNNANGKKLTKIVAAELEQIQMIKTDLKSAQRMLNALTSLGLK